jgi:hypothetical protein
MPTVAPERLLSPVLSFCNEVKSGSTPVFVPLVPDITATPRECFFNVHQAVDQRGGEIVYGWAVWWWPGVFIEAEHHAVWKAPDGSMLDVTPHERGNSATLFVADQDAIFDETSFYRRDNIRKSLRNDPDIQAWLDAMAQRYQLTEKYSSGRAVSAPEDELIAVEAMAGQTAMKVYAKYLKPNDRCPCGSGKKYKKCHSGALRNASIDIDAMRNGLRQNPRQWVL